MVFAVWQQRGPGLIDTAWYELTTRARSVCTGLADEIGFDWSLNIPLTESNIADPLDLFL